MHLFIPDLSLQHAFNQQLLRIPELEVRPALRAPKHVLKKLEYMRMSITIDVQQMSQFRYILATQFQHLIASYTVKSVDRATRLKISIRAITGTEQKIMSVMMRFFQSAEFGCFSREL